MIFGASFGRYTREKKISRLEMIACIIFQASECPKSTPPKNHPLSLLASNEWVGFKIARSFPQVPRVGKPFDLAPLLEEEWRQGPPEQVVKKACCLDFFGGMVLTEPFVGEVWCHC